MSNYCLDLSVVLDKRITLESLKACLESYVGTTADNFEVTYLSIYYVLMFACYIIILVTKFVRFSYVCTLYISEVLHYNGNWELH